MALANLKWCGKHKLNYIEFACHLCFEDLEQWAREVVKVLEVMKTSNCNTCGSDVDAKSLLSKAPASVKGKYE